jgi:Rieske 2Fe-2S family protein
MQEVDNFDRGQYPLLAAATAEWDGFIFVNLSPEPQPFEAVFAPLIGRFERFGLPKLQTARRIEYEVQANWKLMVQNYSECLHCPTLHPKLAHVSPFQSGKNDLVEGPFLGGYMDIIAGVGSLTMTGKTCGLPIGNFPPEDFKRVYYYTLFPNLLLSLHPDYVMYHLLWPKSAGRTRITCDWMFHPESFRHPDFEPEDAISFWDMTNRQDWAICEQSQAGIQSRAYRQGPYSMREGLLAAWDRQYLRSLGG